MIPRIHCAVCHQAKYISTEPAIMAGSYGVAAGTLHSWVGSIAVTIGYFIVAAIETKKASKEAESNRPNVVDGYRSA